MRPMAAVLLAVLASGASACSPVREARPVLPLPPPAGEDAPGLPRLPAVSPRNASYTIEARFDPDKHTIAGSLILDWRNTADRPLSTFPFHLYWNAFRNDLSTTARGEDRRAPEDPRREERSFGWIRVESVRLLAPGAPEADLLPSAR